MKPYLLSLALLPLLLAGCAPSGYVGDYPGPGYYGPDYYPGPVVGVNYYDNGGYYSRGYHHYANNYHHAYAGSTRTSYHTSSGTRFASTSGGRHASGSHGTASAHVSSGHVHD